MVWHSDPRSQDGCRKDTERDGISIKLPNGNTLTMSRMTVAASRDSSGILGHTQAQPQAEAA